MAKFTIEIEDEYCWGITKAREAHNAGLPPQLDEQGVAVADEDRSGHCKTDEAYVAWVMESAADSYCVQYGKCPTCGQPKA